MLKAKISNSEHLGYLALSIISAILSIYAGTAGKFASLILGVWFISKKDFNYFPYITIITSFLSTGYIMYLQMFVICLLNLKKIRERGLGGVFFIYMLMVITFLFFSVIKFINTDVNLGKSMTDYIFILTLSPFFYGMVIINPNMEYKNEWEKLYLALLVITLINILGFLTIPFFEYSRLLFFIIPYLFLYILLNIYKPSNLKLLIFTIGVLLMMIIWDGLTFTVIFTALMSVLLFKQKSKSFFIPILLIVFVFFVPFFAINNSVTLDFTEYEEMEITDIKNWDDLKGRVGMKLIEDRAPIWTAAWIEINKNLTLLPPLEKYKLYIEQKSNIGEREWEFHSHNLFLESLLRLGLILGILVFILFLYYNFLSFKSVNNSNLGFWAKSFVLVAITTNFMGSMTGIFTLLLDYTFLPLSIMGGYLVIKKRHN